MGPSCQMEDYTTALHGAQGLGKLLLEGARRQLVQNAELGDKGFTSVPRSPQLLAYRAQ